MKLFKSLLLFIFLTLFANANGEVENIEVLKNLYEKVIIKDIDLALKDLNEIENSLKNKDENRIKSKFSDFVKSWKSVETFYILGDLNEDFIDIPRYIDIFHNTNEDIKEQLTRAINSDDEIRVVLFKNSLKSINALEYILFENNIKNERVNKIAITISSKIKEHLNDIKNEYISQEQNFLKDLKKANAIVINAIIQNSYKLKEWRIGDVMGLTKKYKNNPDNRRAEYFISKNSANAIEAILQTYKNVLDNKEFNDFGDFLVKLTNGKQMNRLKKTLNNSLIEVKNIKNDDFTSSKKLYENINTLHVILFVEMIEELSINAKILDADGD